MARPFGTKNIESPEILWEYFDKYVSWVNNNPFKKMVFVGKDGMKEYEERERPLTLTGFESYLFKEGVIKSHLNHYCDEKNESYKDYLPIITHIKGIISDNQISGGMAGIFQHTLTARLNGLVEKSSVEVTKEQPLLPDVNED